MDHFYLIGSLLCLSSTNILGTAYNRKNKKRIGISQIYNLLLVLSAFVVWLVSFLMDRRFDLKVIPYALIFAFCYTVGNFGVINSLKTGSVMLTSLFGKLSLIVTTIWGFFFWDTPFTYLTGIGLAMTAISIFLCLYNGKGEKKRKTDPKWFFYLSLVLIGNAGCTVVQKTQQMDFDGEYGSFFMLVAVGASLFFFGVMYLGSDKRDTGAIVKVSWYFPVSAGVANALLNLFVILLATSSLSPSLIYPLLAVGSLAVVMVASLFIFKEKMRPWQWIGVALGALAMAILSF